MVVKKNEKADLEKNKGLFFQVGFILALSTALFIMEKSAPANKSQNSYTGIEIEFEMLPFIESKDLKPPPPKPDYVSEIKIVENSAEIIETVNIDAEITENEMFYIDENIEDKEEEEYYIGETLLFSNKMPEFIGGKKALLNFIRKNTKYPNEAIEKDIQGRVYVRFLITEEGEIKKAEVIRRIHPLLDKEALRVINEMPKWIPGENNGKKVSVSFSVPVNFILEKQ
jgi:protein TonB